MIIPPKDNNAHPASAWTAGVVALFLAIGFSGAVTPLLPDRPFPPPPQAPGDLVTLETFDAPPAPATQEPAADPTESPPEQDREIPPVPEITPPLLPPEMAEITPLDPVAEKPKPAPVAKPPVPKSRPSPAAPAVAATGNSSAVPGSGPASAGNPGGTGNPSAQSGAGKGRFPQPAYPAAARRAGLQGNVRLAITVEAGGLPSSVRVVSSSGHPVLDAAARDQVQRRWRWPTGPVRQFIIPIRFVLQ